MTESWSDDFKQCLRTRLGGYLLSLSHGSRSQLYGLKYRSPALTLPLKRITVLLL